MADLEIVEQGGLCTLLETKRMIITVFYSRASLTM